eukprot:196782-Amphidinium_carterae.2
MLQNPRIRSARNHTGHGTMQELYKQHSAKFDWTTWAAELEMPGDLVLDVKSAITYVISS